MTIEFISFADGKKMLFWAIDLKLGYSESHSQINFIKMINSAGLFASGANNNDSNLQEYSDILTRNDEYNIFSIPFIISNRIARLKMKELVNVFRTEHLIYDLDKKKGIIFSISDIIQAGIIGIFGTSESNRSCLQILEETLSTLKSLLPEEGHINTDLRYDEVEISELISSIKGFIKLKMKVIAD